MIYLFGFVILLAAIGTLWGRRVAAWVVLGVFAAGVLGAIVFMVWPKISDMTLPTITTPTSITLTLFAGVVGFAIPIVKWRRVRRFGVKHKWTYRIGIALYIYGILMASTNAAHASSSLAAFWAYITLSFGTLTVAAVLMIVRHAATGSEALTSNVTAAWPPVPKH